MCKFIFIVVPNDSNFNSIKKIAEDAGLTACKPVGDGGSGFVPEQGIAQESALLCTTVGMCDCGTVMGSKISLKSENNKIADRLRDLQRKGWSQSRIDRWIEEVDKKPSRRTRVQTDANEESARWHSFMSSLLEDINLTHIGFFFHECDNRPYAISGGEALTLDDITPGRLESLDPDKVYVVKSRRA